MTNEHHFRNLSHRFEARLVTLTVLGLALAGTATASPASAAEPITCGAVVTTDVRLTADLDDCQGPGLVVGADGVTINLAGHTVDGTGIGAGVDNSAGHDDLVIRRGTIRQFLFGVELFEAEDVRVERVLVDSSVDGFKVSRSAHVTLDRVTARSSLGSGVEITFSEDVTVRDSRASGSGLWGVVDRFSYGSRFEHNTLVRNGASGLTVDSVEQAVVARNHSTGNQSAGLELVTTDDARVVANRAVANAGDGIFLGGAGNTVTANRAFRNAGIGIAAPAGTVDGGRNRAFRNGEGDCTAVRCR